MDVVEPGSTCWRRERAGRVALLSDAASYFEALRRAILAAERSVIIVGWDVDTRTLLIPTAHPEDGLPAGLLDFLNAVLAQKPALTVHVLAWDFSVIYALERELMPSYKFASLAHPRLFFALDGRHQVGASHHQKLVVIDDRLAFCGGIDLTIRRWDTCEHRTHDPRRVDPQGEPYDPMHDVQLAVDGDVARALGELARQRWQRATGEPLRTSLRNSGSWFWQRPVASRQDLWPRELIPDFQDVDVAIARTESSTSESHRDIREVLHLTLRAIGSARAYVFIENQYFTAAAVAEAVACRLAEPQGPEIVMVLPRLECGWLEQSSMGVLRERTLRKLFDADRHGKLRVYYPALPELADGCLNVHSKVIIVDDRLLKIGSANLSNRSMGLDTECDLVIEAPAGEAGARVRRDIARVRDRLLGEHLALDPAEVGRRVRAAGSLREVIEACRGNPRCLEPVPLEHEPPLNLAALEQFVVDPERPMAADAFINSLLPAELQRPVPRSLFALAVMLLPLVLLGVAWHTPALRALPVIGALSDVLHAVRDSPWTALYVIGMFLAFGLVLCPVTLLVTMCMLAFGPLHGCVYAMLGSLSSATAMYIAGRLLGRVPLKHLSGPRMSKLRAELRRRAFRATTAARLFPLGNFTAINLLAGALYVPFLAFLAGNIVGLTPGLLGIALFSKQLENVLRAPTPENTLVLLMCGFALGGALWLLGRLLGDTGEARPAKRAFTERMFQ